MKKILYILFVVVLIGFVSCDKSNKAGYMGDVDARLSKAVAEYQDALVSATDGWMMVISTKSGGAFRFWMEFNDNNRVNMYTDFFEANGHAVKETPQESSYSFRLLQRPTLCFDTYSYIHVLADPSGEINGGVNGKGLISDFEFEVVAFKDGKFTLQGRQNKREAYLVKATVAEKAAVLAGKLLPTQQQVDMTFSNIKRPYIAIADREIIMTMYAARYVEFTYRTENDGVGVVGGDCHADFNGDIVLLSPVDVLGVMIEKFVANGIDYIAIAGNTQIPVQSTVSTVDVTKVIPYEGKNALIFQPDFSQVSSFFKEAFKKTSANLYAVKGHKISEIEISISSINGVPSASIAYSFKINNGALASYGTTIYPLFKNSDGSYSFGSLPKGYDSSSYGKNRALLDAAYKPMNEEYFGKYRFMITATESDKGFDMTLLSAVGYDNRGTVAASLYY